MMQSNAPITSTNEAVEASKIAVVGLAGRFPGAQTIDQFWTNLRAGVEARTTFSDETLAPYLSRELLQDPAYVKAGFVLDQVADFDADFFDFTGRQAQITDPQQRIFLECVWEALESAGIDLAQSEQLIGLYAGASQSTYATNNPTQPSNSMVESLPLLIGNDKDYLATQTAYRLNLQGPCMTIQSACSTGLVAVHVACQSLLNFECDVAVAGAVTVRLPQDRGYLFEDGGILAADGHCRAFDAAATGTVFGSGAGVVVLKRLGDALADGDQIWAVIRGSAINNDGARKFNFTTSSPMGQMGVISEAWNMAGVTPEMLTYIETHGTGTQVGDPIEVDTLASLFAATGTTEKFCAIGSVKTNVGHLESAAGITGLIKTVLALHHRQIPPSLHFERPNPKINFADMPLYVNTALIDWETPRLPRCAGVSSFGIGGTNAHLVLEEAPQQLRAMQGGAVDNTQQAPQLLTLSAKNEPALRALAARYAAFLANTTDADLADICYTSHIGRTHFAHRLSAVGTSPQQLSEVLLAYGKHESVSDVNHGVVLLNPAGSSPAKIAFLFTGQGSQYREMGRELYAQEPCFRAVLERCDRVFQQVHGRSLLALLYPATPPEHNDLMESHPCGQAANFALECALADLWRSWGIQPDVVLGHSLGDFAAAYTAGVLTLEDGLRLVTARGQLMEQALGSMLSVLASEAEVAPFLAAHSAVTVGVINGPRSLVLSGAHEAVAAVDTALQAAGFKTRKLDIPVAAHSPMLDPVLDAFEATVRTVPLQRPQLAVVSSMTGQLVDTELTDPAYWRKHLRNTVRFADGVQTLLEQHCTVFLEIGPKPTLLGMVEQILETGTHDTSEPLSPALPLSLSPCLIPSLREGQDDRHQLLRALGALYGQGVAIDWQTVDGAEDRHKVTLPTYPFQRQRYWLDVPKTQRSATIRPLIDRIIKSPAIKETIFEAEFGMETLPYLADHRVYGAVVSPGACQIAMAFTAAALSFGRTDGLQVTDVILPQALVIPEEKNTLVQAIFTPATLNGQGERYDVQILSFAPDKVDSVKIGASATHLVGQGSITPPGEQATVDLAQLRQQCSVQLDLSPFYEALAQQEITLGASFRWPSAVWQDQHSSTPAVLAQLRKPQNMGRIQEHLLHPGLLDACFQVAGMTDAPSTGETRLPFAVAALQLHRPLQGERWWCYAHNVEDQKWDIQLLDEQGHLLLTIWGFEVRVALPEAIRGQDAWHDWLYQVAWQPQPYIGLQPDYLPTPATLASAVRTALPALLAQIDSQQQGLPAALDALSIDYLLTTFAAAGLPLQPGTEWRDEQLAQQLGLVPAYHRLLQHLLMILAEAGIVQRSATGRYRLNHHTPNAPAARYQALCAQFGDTPELTLLARCGQQLAEILRGEQDPLTVLFPAGDTTVATQLYRESGTMGLINHIVQQVVTQVVAALPAERGVQILEIGAGTGGTTAGLLPLLPPERTHYHFTDIGPAFLRKAEEEFAGYPFVDYQQLDIEKPPTDQGFRRGQADLIIAANVLHATRDLGETLAHVHQLLQPGGQLVLVEGTVRSTWVDLTFGLTEGWWRFADDRQEHPLLTAAEWQRLLAANGFQAIEIIEEGGQAVILAQAAAHISRQPEQQADAPWLLFVDRQGIGEALAAQLQQQGEETLLVYAGPTYQQLDAQTLQIRPDAGEDYQRLLSTVPQHRGVVHLWSLDTPEPAAGTDLVAAVEQSCGTALHLVQTLLKTHADPTSALWLVTHNTQRVEESAQITGIAQAGLWGMGKVIALEHPELNCRTVDLAGTLTPAQQAAYLCAELLTTTPQSVAEAQIVLGATARYVARLDRFSPQPFNSHLAADATYLITGGLGGLGLATAEWLANQGAHHLLLMGRTEPTAQAMVQVEKLRAAGVTVSIHQGDVTDRAHVQALLDSIDPATPLRGIIHAAGVLDDGVLAQQQWARFAKVLAPKVQGAWHLHELTQAMPLDFFLLFSSSASIVGNEGQANHAAANAILDAIAQARQAKGLPALAINWGGWSEIGAAAELIQRQRETLSRQGIGVIPPQLGLAALTALHSQPAAQITVMPIHWPRYLTADKAANAFFARIVAQILSENAGPEPTVTTIPEVRAESAIWEELQSARPTEHIAILRTYVQQEVAQLLGLSTLPALQVGFHEMGLDSLLAIELKNRLARALPFSLPSTVAFEYPTVAELATYILESCTELMAADLTTESGHAQPAMAQAATDTSDMPLTGEDLLSFITKEFEQTFQ